MTLKPTSHVSLASEITINVFYVLMLDHVRLATAISRWTELRRQDVLACLLAHLNERNQLGRTTIPAI